MSNTYSQKISEREIKLILKYMSKHLIKNSALSIKYFFKTKNYTITIYKNNTIFIQGKSFENILKIISSKDYKKSNIHIANFDLIKIGSDEVGTGDLFGGIVVCACRIINKEMIDKINIRDSKLISDNEIKEIYNKIKNYVEYEKYEIFPTEYNQIYDKYKNLNIVKTIGHYQTIKSLQQNSNDIALIDQYCSEKKFNEYLGILNLKKMEKIRMETKAENKYIEVACASIIARYFFVEQINKLSKKINIKLPLGSSNKNIKIIVNKINSFDKHKFLKLHFKNSQ